MRIEVYRGAGDRRGADIEAPLLAGEAALIERGRAELNDRAHPRESVSLVGIPKAGMLPGALARANPAGKAPWVGRITSVAFSADGVRSIATLGLERPV